MQHSASRAGTIVLAGALVVAAFFPMPRETRADYLDLEGRITGLFGTTPDGLDSLAVDDEVHLQIGVPDGPSSVVDQTAWMRTYQWTPQAPGPTVQRLQDLQVTVEVRFVTLNDDFFERIGVDFDLSLGDNVGVSIHNNDPVIGGLDAVNFSYDATATADGSNTDVGLGVTFYSPDTGWISANDVLQAPKVTLFNGQSATVSDTSQRPFVISVVPVVGAPQPTAEAETFDGPWTLTGEITRLTVVPEPSTAAGLLVAFSLVALGGRRDRIRRR